MLKKLFLKMKNKKPDDIIKQKPIKDQALIKEQAKAALVDQRQKLNINLMKNHSQQVVAGGKASTKDESKSVNTFGHFKKSIRLVDSVSSPNSLNLRKIIPSSESDVSWENLKRKDFS